MKCTSTQWMLLETIRLISIIRSSSREYLPKVNTNFLIVFCIFIEQVLYVLRIFLIQGVMIGEPFTEEIGKVEKDFVVPPGYCGPCYGGQVRPEQCCNTCAEVIEAYRVRGWNVKDIKRTAEQCRREQAKPLQDIEKGEGCNVAGLTIHLFDKHLTYSVVTFCSLN